MPMPCVPFDSVPARGPAKSTPSVLSAATLFCVVMLFHMCVLHAGQRIDGLRWYCHATNTDESRLSAMPLAILPIVLQVTGATTTQSAQSQSARCEARSG